MRRDFIRLCLLSALVPALHARAAEQEQLTEVVSGYDKWPAGRIVTFGYEFDTGLRQKISPPLVFSRVGKLLMSRAGQTLLLEGFGSSSSDRITAKALDDWTGSPAVAFQQYNSASLSNPTLSPDGKAVVAFDYVKQQLVLVSSGRLTVLPIEWFVGKGFSWSPDSRQAAFYCAKSSDTDGEGIQEHGVAVISIDGRLRVVREPQQDKGTRLTTAKDIPIGWTANGERVYFSEGELAPGAPAGMHERRQHRHSVVTMRAEIATGKCEQVADGEFCDVAPDEKYVIVQRSFREDRKPVSRCVVLDMEKRAERVLPAGLTYPKLSPSGKLAACMREGGSLVCLRTDTWEAVGKPVPTGRDLLSIDKWATDFRWITPPISSQPATRGE